MIDTPASLLQRLRLPDDSGAWPRFVELYTPLFERWARRLEIGEQDIPDVVQETLVAVLHSLPDFVYRGRGSFRAWLRTILKNKWIDLARKSPPRPLSGLSRIADRRASGTDVFEDAEYQSDVAVRMLRLIESEFEESTRRAFLMFAVDNKPADEVARALGITSNAVYLAKARVLRRLREELGELWD